MANLRVAIYQSAKVNGVWSYYRPVTARNNKIKPDWCHVNGHKEHHPDSDYIIKWYEGKRQRTRKCKNAADAQNEAEIQRSVLNARSLGIAVTEPAGPSLLLSAAIYAYLEDYRLTHRPNSYCKTKQTLEEFLGYAKRTNLGDVTRIDVLKYREWLLKNKRSPRTACDKFLTVHSFLKSKGIRLVSGRDAPKYVEEMPEVYTQEELDAFFKACDSTESLIFSVFLKVGLRERELIHLEWSDLNFKESTLRVSAKPHYGWVPKTNSEREMVVPEDLTRALEQHSKKSRKGRPQHNLVFPNIHGRPNEKLLRWCKDIAKKAELDEKKFYLHKFRSTYATACLRSGLDVPTVQYLLGHKDVQSTMRYLAPATNDIIKEKLNKVWKKKISMLFPVATVLPDGSIAVSASDPAIMTVYPSTE
ncbi:MAG: tyrosine-type recombinase/integrase [Terriglobales bacterium]